MAAAKYHVDITTSTLVPTPENAGLAAGCDGVTILGQGHIDRHLLERYHALGIRFLSTRTIGSNHIDLQAAHELGIQVCSANYPPQRRGRFHRYDDPHVPAALQAGHVAGAGK